MVINSKFNGRFRKENYSMSKYLNNDGTLKDKEVVVDIRKAADMYEDGELIEAQSILVKIVNAIDDFDAEI